MTKETTVAISEFKARCLKLLDDVNTQGTPLVVTKRGRPIVRISPVRTRRKSRMGDWAGKVKIKGDIVYFDTSDEWESA